MEETQAEQKEVPTATIDNGLEWWESYEATERLKCYLYKKDSSGKYPQITRFDGIVPDPHDIGLKFGGGEYRVNIKYPSDSGKLLSTSKLFELGDHYDSQHKTENSGLSGGSPLTPDLITGAVVTAISGMVKEFLPIVTPMLSQKKETFGDALQDVYLSSTRVLEDSMKRQSTMLNGLMKDFSLGMKESFTNLSDNQVAYQREPDEDYEEEEEGQMSIIGKMAWGFIEPHIMGIVSGGGSELIEQAKSNPIFQQVINSPEAVTEIQTMILNQFGMSVLNVVNEKLGL